MLDPWCDQGVGGVMDDGDYDRFIEKLLQRACAISEHVYLWGFPESWPLRSISAKISWAGRVVDLVLQEQSVRYSRLAE